MRFLRNFKLLIVISFISLFFSSYSSIDNRFINDFIEENIIYIAPNGKINNLGTKESPLSFPAGILKASKIIKAHGVPKGGLTIYLRGGKYSIDNQINLGSEFVGTKESPIIIRNYPGEKVFFDGGKKIEPVGFKKVASKKEQEKLAKSAKKKVLVKTITDSELIKKLTSKVVLNLNIDNEIYLPSCYPNGGYAELKYEPKEAEVSPPAIPRDASGRAGMPPYVESGKPRAWKGTITEPRGAQVGIGKRESEMAGSWNQWEKEINSNNTRNLLTGFISADWLLESHPIFAANGKKETIHLSQVVAYGWYGDKHKQKDFKVYGLLCELDEPGEWHFDTKTNRFYIYPPKPMEVIKQMGFPYSEGFMALNKTEYVSIIGLNVKNVGAGIVFNVNGGKNNTIAGCKINNCTAQGIRINGGMYNGVSGCDLFDLNSHVNISGGTRNSKEITPAYNYAENCHIYQVKYNHEKVGIGLNGVGNIFTNNLAHNSIGQAMMIRGNEHIIERNEFFNIGYDEGDGGAMYAGADLVGYGTAYRHNFFHHLINVPGKVTRAGIHLDDLQAGSILTGNIFYKSAEKGIFMNGGSGHVIRDNVFLEGALGVYNVANSSKRKFDLQEDINANSNHNNKGLKEDYLGNAEKITGKNGWNNEPWISKYPRLALVMNDKGENGYMWPIRCIVSGNMYYGNSRGDKAVWSRFSPESQNKSIINNEKVISPDYFMDYSKLDLQFKKQRRDLPEIPFNKIGLYLDDYRSSMPDKNHYRMAIKEFFKGVKSMPGTTKQINTGKVVENGPIITRTNTSEVIKEGSQCWKPLFNDEYEMHIAKKNGYKNDVQLNDIFEFKGDSISVLYKWTDKVAPFAVIATKKSYSNYDLKLEYKWGKRKFYPRHEMVRDAGILFHVYDYKPKTFPRSLECQIQENDTGDLWILGSHAIPIGPDGKDIPMEVSDKYSKNSKRYLMSEKEGWNQVRIEVRGNSAKYFVNGQLVNRFKLSTKKDSKTPLDSGYIALQAEGAEVIYRNVLIREIFLK
ncbi:family 16 glycoside hydrolase [Flavivirga abyssicola]|uniref:family 16 glycoside hydrolase n=1 Tax=Flavivirga abyssicola TaxID=3063533 RepID=UPI0026DF4272|nr:family 16 glycoside hydrolase [Flavivirga sp. MEBiC07777]WVK11656.1 family 16 glycoside hydrolase [Flavivirga sp. MEBiC07777]